MAAGPARSDGYQLIYPQCADEKNHREFFTLCIGSYHAARRSGRRLIARCQMLNFCTLKLMECVSWLAGDA